MDDKKSSRDLQHVLQSIRALSQEILNALEKAHHKQAIDPQDFSSWADGVLSRSTDDIMQEVIAGFTDLANFFTDIDATGDDFDKSISSLRASSAKLAYLLESARRMELPKHLSDGPRLAAAIFEQPLRSVHDALQKIEDAIVEHDRGNDQHRLTLDLSLGRDREINAFHDWLNNELLPSIHEEPDQSQSTVSQIFSFIGWLFLLGVTGKSHYLMRQTAIQFDLR